MAAIGGPNSWGGGTALGVATARMKTSQGFSSVQPMERGGGVSRAPMSRHARGLLRMLVLRVVLATLWAGLLCVAGLWVMVDWTDRFPAYRWACLIGGGTALAMGQFVFAALVADRLFPRVNPWVSWSIQGVSGLVYVAGLAVLGLLLTGVIR
ncbi:MAG: hypothetical protein IBJ18_10100 [Phycisphaerales bacterium]|nr:hypothetical protein [Phycisphaerales bacterium]